jgi:hypothetical protein
VNSLPLTLSAAKAIGGPSMLEAAAEYYLRARAVEMSRRAERLARVAMVRKAKKTVASRRR